MWTSHNVASLGALRAQIPAAAASTSEILNFHSRCVWSATLRRSAVGEPHVHVRGLSGYEPPVHVCGLSGCGPPVPGTNKAVKARFWPWIEPFPGERLSTLVRWYQLARQPRGLPPLVDPAARIQGYLAWKKPPPPSDHHRSLGMVLLQGPTGWQLLSEVLLYTSYGVAVS